MAVDLKEYVRESIKQYLKVIKTKFYTKAEVDAKDDAQNATNLDLVAYSTPVSTLGSIGATDTIQLAIRKLDYNVSNATVTALSSVASGVIIGRIDPSSGDSQELTPTQVRTLLNIEDGANNYVHPSIDGSLHVLATGTTNAGKVLTAGSTAGSLTWETPSDGITNLSTSYTVSSVTVSSSSGTDATISAVTAIDSGVMTPAMLTKLNNIEDGAEVNVQSDYTEVDNALDSFIKNKPDLSIYELIANKGSSNGYPSLDANGKIPASQLPDSVVGGMKYVGSWNAATNVPDLGASTPIKGDYYIVSVDGGTTLDGNSDWKATDWVSFNGATWDKIDNTQATQVVRGIDIVATFNDVTFVEANTDWDNAV